MNDMSRRDAVRLAAGLAVGAVVFAGEDARGHEPKKSRRDLEAVFHIEVDRQTV